MAKENILKIRPLEQEDLKFVHRLDNNPMIMRYWFEEPYESFLELSDLYNKHIHDKTERRFILEKIGAEEPIGLVELMEIEYAHRRAEFQIIITPNYQGKGYATIATKLAMDYAFSALNLYKLYLVVDEENAKAIHIYTKLGFEREGVLKHEFFSDGSYHNAVRMCIFQDQYLKRYKNTSKEIISKKNNINAIKF